MIQKKKKRKKKRRERFQRVLYKEISILFLFHKCFWTKILSWRNLRTVLKKMGLNQPTMMLLRQVSTKWASSGLTPKQVGGTIR